MSELIHLEFNEQIQLFKDRNMTFKDELNAIQKLQHINYYKIKEFAEPFCTKKEGLLDYSNISFEYVLKRYYNDKHLRMNLFDAIENIEVSIKTNLSHVLGSGKMGAYGYLKFFSWCNRNEYCTYCLRDKEKEFKTKFTKYLTTTTNNEIKRKIRNSNFEFPPVWLMVNILTFGDLVKIIELLSTSKLKKLANVYGITGEELLSWLKTLNLVRNLCAHNSNIIDLKLKTTPKIHEKWKDILYVTKSDKYTNRLASVLCIINTLVGKINPNYNFKSIKLSLDEITTKNDSYSEMLGFKDYGSLEKIYEDKVRSRRKKIKKKKRR